MLSCRLIQDDSYKVTPQDMDKFIEERTSTSNQGVSIGSLMLFDSKKSVIYMYTNALEI